jgi:hypothetical protein
VALASGSSRAGVAPAEVQRLSRRTVMPIEIDRYCQSRCRSGEFRSTKSARLPCGKLLATHRRIDGIEDTQTMNIGNAAHGDRIAQISNLTLRVGKRRPRGKAWTVRIA